MLPLSKLTQSEAKRLQGVLFDLDDTLLDHGKLSEEAYRALFLLKYSGLQLIALTGRPASWGELVARMWPVDAAVAENGAIAFESDGVALQIFDTALAAERTLRQTKLRQLVQRTRQTLPDLVPASDVAGRVSDFTFDIGETQNADEDLVQQAIALAHTAGARTTRSSVHLHFTYDFVDKATGALSYLQDRGVDSTIARAAFLFVGDSQNDAPCFSAFKTTVGVANCRGVFSIPPAYRTEGSRGAGFVEMAEHLARLRTEGASPRPY